ncbi:replicative DNA helicase [Peribacillus frigoritolerans]|uniref:replicative DNA helicase n=1 Tax=Peribacillus frigoritolerans TaxID=450367 RepID=UPI0024BFDF55|nr:replicative DNA helicase [Peribacillus frigoritolerans]WHY15733.1 replicative DNA helicase [Peribacillus frigoritolerans]
MEEQLLYNLEVEKSYLGILLAEPGLIKDAKIKPFQLSPGKNFNVLWTLQDLDEKGIPIDFVTVMERVGRKNIEKIGGPDYLGDLAASVPSTASFTYYEKIIHEYWQRREAVTVANQIKESALTEEPAIVIQTGINDLMRLEDNSTDDDDGSIKDDLVAVYDELETPKGEITGMPTGFNELDRMTAGLQKQDFIVIAARPSVGKTAFALNIAEGVAKQEQFAVGIFSLEMGRKQLLKRMISSNGRINAQHIKTSNLIDKDWGKLTGAMGDVSNLNLRIFDNSGITVNQIWAKVRKMKRDYEGKDILVIIDYLQLITGSAKHKGNRTQEISEISRMLKHLARELDVCVIALSQLSRAVEQRQDKRPMMSDIRESGQIEQDADVIGFLYRDDYYDKESESKNIIEIIIGKQRNGPIGTISLAFIKEYGVFLNLERRHDG